MDGAATRRGRGIRFNEDWLATVVGLALLAAALLGWIPKGVLW